jgi:hypothetical protein
MVDLADSANMHARCAARHAVRIWTCERIKRGPQEREATGHSQLEQVGGLPTVAAARTYWLDGHEGGDATNEHVTERDNRNLLEHTVQRLEPVALHVTQLASGPEAQSIQIHITDRNQATNSSCRQARWMRWRCWQQTDPSCKQADSQSSGALDKTVAKMQSLTMSEPRHAMCHHACP